MVIGGEAWTCSERIEAAFFVSKLCLHTNSHFTTTHAQVRQHSMLHDIITEADIAAVVARATGIPVTKLQEAEGQKLLHLADELHRRVIGQDQAVEAVAEAVLRSRAGLGARERPSSFLFLGPTGVGKTELAKALAFQLFDSDKEIVRIDMST